MLKRDEIQALYAAGSEGVVTLVEQLQAHIAQLSTRISELELRLKLDSHNSHKPPSSDGLAKKPAHPPRHRSGKKPGAQPGHPGVTRKMSETPDQTILHTPLQCTQCGSVLADVAALDRERRQVIELPPLRYQVIEHQAEHKTCPHCQTLNRGVFPAQVSQPVQYGSQLRALLVYLQAYQLLPYDRTCELLSDLFRIQPAAGTLAASLETAYLALAPVEVQIFDALVHAPVVHYDETGIRINGQTHWLHQAGTAMLTFFAHHARRGREAMVAVSPLAYAQGVAVHDALLSYLSFDCTHALCNAHLLRELIALSEQGHTWAAPLRTLLLDIKQAVASAKQQGLSALAEAQLQVFTQAYLRLVANAQQVNPRSPPDPERGGGGRHKQTPACNLLQRLSSQHEAILRFMHDFAVPFDNNLAERDLRMTKLRQKISGCFRSADGASTFCRLRGYIATLRKQGLPIFSALESTFLGSPLLPNFE